MSEATLTMGERLVLEALVPTKTLTLPQVSRRVGIMPLSRDLCSAWAPDKVIIEAIVKAEHRVHAILQGLLARGLVTHHAPRRYAHKVRWSIGLRGRRVLEQFNVGQEGESS